MTPPSKYRNKFNRKSSVRSTAKYLIFAEGTKTEQNYFSANELKRCLRNSNFEVVKKTDTDTSDPINLYNYAKRYLKENNSKIKKEDKIVFVIDLEMGQSGRYDKCKKLYQLTSHKLDKYIICITNPCIELWFIMHHGDFEQLEENTYDSANLCKQKFNELFSGQYKEIYDKLDIAIDNAEKLIKKKDIDVNYPCVENEVYTTLHLLFKLLKPC